MANGFDYKCGYKGGGSSAGANPKGVQLNQSAAQSATSRGYTKGKDAKMAGTKASGGGYHA